jgi:hypothetical protein
MAEGSSTSDRIKELQQERALLQWMIDNQKRVNNGISSYLKARREILVIDQQIAEAAKQLAKSQKIIDDLEKENEGRQGRVKKYYDEKIKQQKKFHAGVQKTLDDLDEEQKKLKGTLNIMKAITKSLTDQLKKFTEQHFSLKQLKKVYLEYDKAVRMTQVSMGATAGAADMIRRNLAEAAYEGARYGISVAEMAANQRDISESIGRQLIMTSEQLAKFGVMNKLVPGVANELASLFDVFGKSLEYTGDMMQRILTTSVETGLNFTRLTKENAKNAKLATRFRFKGGLRDIEGISKQMVRLRTNFESIAGFAEKVFRPEGAIEAAAQLQVLGGAMANLGDPFMLMYKARNDVAGFTEEVLKATKFTGMWDKKTQEFTLTANELDRLRELAKITGQSMEDLAVQARQQIRFDAIGGEIATNFTGKDKELIENLAVMKDGKFKMNVSTEVGGEEFVEIGKVTPEQIKLLTDHRQTLEDQARMALTFQEKFDAFLNQLQTLLIPAMDKIAAWLDKWAMKIDKWSEKSKENLAYFLVGAAALFSITAMFGMGMSLGLGFKATSGIGGLSKGTSGASALSGAGALRAGKGQMFKMLGAAAVITAVGAAILMVGHGMKAASEGFATLADSMASLPVTHLETFESIVTKLGVGVIIMAAGLGILAAVLVGMGATSAVMGMAAVVLLAVGAAVLMIGGAVWLAANGMAALVDSMANLMKVEGVGDEILKVGAGLVAMAGGLTLMANPLAMLGMAEAWWFLSKVSKYGPGIQAAGEGVKYLNENLGGLKTSIKNFDADGGMFQKLAQIDKMITRTQSKPIIVEVKGDLGGRLTVDVIGAETERKILLSDGKFITNLTNEISDRIDLQQKISGQ